MRTDDHRAELRGALYRADGRALVAALSTEDWHSTLQLGGDVWPQSTFDDAEETDEDDADEEGPDRWLAVWCEGHGRATGTWRISSPRSQTASGPTAS